DADITYGTNSEFGFDYLRDNMAVSLEQVVQRSHAYAIVDEVDSILIDEARTPLIISGEPETAAKVYYDFARVVKTFDAVPSPAGSWKAAAGARGCTRPSRRRRAFASRRRTSRSRRSRCRTTSASTRSSPA